MTKPTEVTLDDFKNQMRFERLRKARAEADSAEIEAARDRRMEADTLASLNHSQIYNFFEPVTYGGVEDAINWIGMWSRRNPESPIKIVFNSPGGSVFAGMALYDFLQELREKGHHITTEARGYSASMAGILLQAGDERVIGANAHIMIHEISSVALGKASELEDELKLVEKLQEKSLNILAERSTMSKAQIKRKWKRKDWWLDAQEAVELGFADRIG